MDLFEQALGDIQGGWVLDVATGRGGFGPYQIGYGAIVPKQVECENLFVTFALSASHTAMSSIRMEPVFMVTSQSAPLGRCLSRLCRDWADAQTGRAPGRRRDAP